MLKVSDAKILFLSGSDGRTLALFLRVGDKQRGRNQKTLPLPVIEKMLNQIYIMLFTFLTHIFWPDTGLNFTDMCFAEIEHTKA